MGAGRAGTARVGVDGGLFQVWESVALQMIWQGSCGVFGSNARNLTSRGIVPLARHLTSG